MSCPACGHTMALVFTHPLERGYHCPRCGTLRSVSVVGTVDTVPLLVARCVRFEDGIPSGWTRELLLALWASLGIAESIRPPASTDEPPQSGR